MDRSHLKSDDKIDSAARTLAHLTDHFASYKQLAIKMRQSFSARQRGYFTPREDDQVRHLLISYWQSIKALFELIDEFTDDTKRIDQLESKCFVIAYAAAILLVDAGQFMVKEFGDNDIVRAKLNEPEPYFGIPTGVYDTVQMSLTDPSNAWQLHQVNQYFDAHKDQVLKACQDPRLKPVLQVIDLLGQCVRISLAKYGNERLKVRCRKIARESKRPFVGALARLQQFVAELIADIHTNPMHEPCLPRQVTSRLMQMLRPGDIMINRKEYAVTNYFLPGYWPHVALYLGDAESIQRLGLSEYKHVNSRLPYGEHQDVCGAGEPHRVLEAKKDGVQVRSLASVFHCDAVAVIRPILDERHITEAIDHGLLHDSKPYDFDFDFSRSNRLVCTEVVYRSYEGIGGIKFELKSRVGRLTLSAEDLLSMALNRKYFEPIAVYAPGYRKRLLTEQDVQQALRGTMADEN